MGDGHMALWSLVMLSASEASMQFAGDYMDRSREKYGAQREMLEP